jgi:ribonuclease P protein component
LPPSRRITRTREIRELLRRGKRRKTSHLDVFFLSSGEPLARVGLVVPKYQRSAVERNVVKRRLKELSRREVLPRLSGSSASLDVLIRARRGAYDAGYRQVRLELLKVIEELCSGQSSWG